VGAAPETSTMYSPGLEGSPYIPEYSGSCRLYNRTTEDGNVPVSHIELINPQELAPPRGFSHIAKADEWVWLGGQISADRDGQVLYAGDLVAQFKCALENSAVALHAANCTPQDVVKITYYTTDVETYRRSLSPIGDAYRSVFGRHFPASSLFGVAALFEPDALIEIECVAFRRNTSRSQSSGSGE
jgi:enamine deaminase RidA (YjgF/YER057c/UK114 family)